MAKEADIVPLFDIVGIISVWPWSAQPSRGRSLVVGDGMGWGGWFPRMAGAVNRGGECISQIHNTFCLMETIVNNLQVAKRQW